MIRQKLTSDTSLFTHDWRSAGINSCTVCILYGNLWGDYVKALSYNKNFIMRNDDRYHFEIHFSINYYPDYYYYIQVESLGIAYKLKKSISIMNEDNGKYNIVTNIFEHFEINSWKFICNMLIFQEKNLEMMRKRCKIVLSTYEE